MKKLTKQFTVVYNEEGQIIVKTDNNSETYVPEERLYAEFDTQEELDEFIVDNDLKEQELGSEEGEPHSIQ